AWTSRSWPCQAPADSRKFRKPGPAISTAAMSPPVGIASASACAIARGLLRAGLASSNAALLEKSPCARSLGRSMTKSGVARSAGRMPWSRRVAMPCSTRALSVDFTGIRSGNVRPHIVREGPAPAGLRLNRLDPAPGGQRDRRAVADHEMIQQAHVDQAQGLLELGGNRAVGGAGLAAAAGVVV